MSNNIKNIHSQLSKMGSGSSKNTSGGRMMEFYEAIDFIKGKIVDEKVSQKGQNNSSDDKEKRTKLTKEDLRKSLRKTSQQINSIIAAHNIVIRGEYQNNMKKFLEDASQEIAGYSVLADAFNDSRINNIYLLDENTIFVEVNGVDMLYHKKFRDKNHYESVIKRFVQVDQKEVNQGDSKIVNFEFYQDRGCAISSSISPRGMSLTIRKHKEEHITKEQIIEYGVLNDYISEFLGMIILGETNIIYAGITGTGKTTTLRALLDYYIAKANKRMLVCEDTQELFPKNPHTVELVSSVDPSNEENSVPLSKLIETALRLTPKYIIVGEVRGVEAEAAVEGMETGHSTIFSMHGGTAWNIINRLVTKYLKNMPSLSIQIVERIIGEAVDFICIQDNTPNIGRKLTTVTEVNYDFIRQTVILNEIFRFNFIEKRFEQVGNLSEKSINKMLRRGIPHSEILKYTIDVKEGQSFVRMADYQHTDIPVAS